MNESLKEKVILSCRRTMRKHPIFRGPLTVCLFFVLLFFHFVGLITSNTKKLVSLAVLLVFYTISCSFCAPVFQFGYVQEESASTEHLEGENIAFASETMDEEVETVLNEAETIVTQKAENPEIELDEDEEIDNYSVEEILAEHAERESRLEQEAEMSEEDSWKLLLVNKQHPIPEDYSFTLGTITGSLQCDERIIPELLDMLQAAKEDSVSLVICSPYRNLSRQQMLFNRKVTGYMNRGMSYMDAYKYASQAVTIPGSSEHQLGLALDIYTDSYRALDEGFGETQAGIWLHNHCSEYGFILRYPKGKEYITGIEYEPWHFRYVGKEAAKEIMSREICLEEYLE